MSTLDDLEPELERVSAVPESAAPAKAKETGDVGYDSLPASIKGEYTHSQWLWLSDREKGTLVTTECEPDAYEDS